MSYILHYVDLLAVYLNQHVYFKITGLQIKRKKKRRKRKRNGKKKSVVKNYARKMKTMVKGRGKL